MADALAESRNKAHKALPILATGFVHAELTALDMAALPDKGAAAEDAAVQAAYNLLMQQALAHLQVHVAGSKLGNAWADHASLVTTLGSLQYCPVFEYEERARGACISYLDLGGRMQLFLSTIEGCQ